MAKMYGYSGKVTGRKGDTVFSVRHGEQILRQYNPIVNNPSTTKQIDARATLKMMSQLSQIFGNVIAIPRQGAKSPRNLFVKQNYPLAYIEDNKAQIDLTSLQLTNSNIAMENFQVARNSNEFSLNLTNSVAYDNVIYVMVTKNGQGDLKVQETKNIPNATPGQPNNFSTSFPDLGLPTIFFTYAINAKTEQAKVTFQNIETEDTLVLLETIKSQNYNGYEFTKTNATAQNFN